MESSNPHGAGVAWLVAGSKEVSFHRGLTAKEVFEMQELGVMTYPYLLHYRWATHGARTPQLAHPFPTGVRAFMGELSGTAPEVLMHNGVWYGYSAHTKALRNLWSPAILDEMSDTAIAAYLVGNKDYSVLEEMPWATALAYVNDEGKLDVRITGEWKERNGSWFSNLSWVGGYWSSYGSYYSGSSDSASSANHSNPYSYAGGKTYSYPNTGAGVSVSHSTDGEERCKDCYFRESACVCYALDNTGQPEVPGEMTWEAYLKAKYGAAVPDESMETGEYVDPFSDDAFDPWNTTSDDPATVQACLERMMA